MSTLYVETTGRTVHKFWRLHFCVSPYPVNACVKEKLENS